jgi:hypothetical protein
MSSLSQSLEVYILSNWTLLSISVQSLKLLQHVRPSKHRVFLRRGMRKACTARKAARDCQILIVTTKYGNYEVKV